MICTFNSVYEDNYSRISITIPPISHCYYTSVTCLSLTANCNIRVLNKNDYIILIYQDTFYSLYFDDYSNLNVEVFAEILSEIFNKNKIEIEIKIDNCNRYIFISDYPFIFHSISYNIKLLLGLYNKSDNLFQDNEIRARETDGKYTLCINSVGMFLSTPVLHLVSNLGEPSLINNMNNILSIQSCNEVLRINNSFSPNIPIIASGGDMTSVVPAGAVSGSTFVLTDANNVQIDLLSPMYITLRLEGMQTKEDGN